MIIALIIGFITGWLMSMPIGPVNAAVISRTLKYNFRFGIACALGAAIMDTIYCGGAAQINQFLVESPIINLIFQSIGFLALVFLGIKSLQQKMHAPLPEKDEPFEARERNDDDDDDSDDEEEPPTVKKFRFKKKSIFGPFVMGVILYATNVAAVAEWIIVAGIWRGWGLLGSGVDINVLFAIGAGLGTFGWYLVLVRWISRRRRGFKPSTLRKINFGTGIAMLIFGAYFGYQIIFGTNWHNVKTHLDEHTGFLHAPL